MFIIQQGYSLTVPLPHPGQKWWSISHLTLNWINYNLFFSQWMIPHLLGGGGLIKCLSLTTHPTFRRKNAFVKKKWMKSSLYFLDGFKFCRTTYISTIFCFQNLHPFSLAFLTTTTTTKSSDAHACLLSPRHINFCCRQCFKSSWWENVNSRFALYCFVLPAAQRPC